MSHHTGAFVQAAEPIFEEELAGETPFVHAEPGDRGRVLMRDGDWVTVRWDRRGSIVDCHVEQIRLEAALTPPLRVVG